MNKEEILSYIRKNQSIQSVEMMAQNLRLKKKQVRWFLRESRNAPKTASDPGLRPQETLAATLDHPRGWISLLDMTVILGAALLIRTIYQYQINQFPYLNIPMVDAERYVAWAKELAAGDWLGKTVFFQAPGYPYFLGVLFSLFGQKIQTIQWIQQVMGAGMCLVMYWTARNLFGRFTGLLTGLLTAAFGVLVCYSGFLIKSTLELFLLSGVLLLLSLQAKKLRYTAIFFAGVFLALSALVRENLMILSIFFALWLFLKTAQMNAVKRGLVIGCFLAGIGLPLLPVAVRNHIVGHDFVLLTSQGGAVLYEGNHPRANGTYQPFYPNAANAETEARYVREIAEKAEGRSLKPSEVSRYWIGQVLKFAREHTAEFLSLQLRKFQLFWNAYEIPDTESYYFYQRFSPLLDWLPVRFGWVAVLGLAGTFFTRRNRDARVLHLMILGSMFMTLPFFVFTRHRLPLVLPLTILAAHSLQLFSHMAEGDRSGPPIASFAGITLCSALLVFSIFPIPDLKKAEISTAFYNLGVSHERHGELKEALDYFNQSVDASDKSYLARQHLMELAMRRGDFAEAGKWAEQILNIRHSHPEAWFVLGEIAEQQGKREEARNAYQKCLEGDPTHSHAGAQEGLKRLLTIHL